MDWFHEFLSKLAPYVAFGIIGWVSQRLVKLFRDVDAAHQKLRELEQKMK